MSPAPGVTTGAEGASDVAGARLEAAAEVGAGCWGGAGALLAVLGALLVLESGAVTVGGAGAWD